MNYTALLNNIKVGLENYEEINYSWATNFPSPNPTFSLTNTIQLRATNDTQDGYNVYKKYIAANGVFNAIPFKLLYGITGDTLFNGHALPYSANSFEDLQRLRVELEIIEQDLQGLLSSLNLYSLTNKDVAFQTINCVLEDKTRSELQILIGLLSILNMQINFALTADKFFSALDVNPLDPGDVVVAILILTFQLSVTIYTLIQLIEEIKPKTAKYYSVNVKQLLEVSCGKLGLNFKSGIFDGVFQKMFYISETDYDGKQNTPVNKPCPKKTLFEFFEELAVMFNARIKQVGNTLYFERIDYYWQYNNPINGQNSNFAIKNLEDNGVIRYNMPELFASTKVKFATDSAELNTKQRPIAENPQPNSLVVSYKIKPAFVKTPKNLGLQGVNNIDIPFARAMRKDSETFLEEAFRVIYNLFSELVDIVSFGLIDIEQIPNTIGFMKISDYNVGTPKVFFMENNRIATDNLKYINAKYIYDNYQKVSTVEGDNQWILVSNVAISTEQANKVRRLRNWNVAKDSKGRGCIVTKYEEDLTTNTYTIEYRYKQTYLKKNQIDVTIVTE